ncbi:sensor histidine kinase [Lacticaseibacillus saniviri]|uniref:sensor histidine kinase n=1 Tax=Lacticaseibacillus saniviri TaxID=931533 RepID=UPI001EE14CC1|nr:HAMP domain-containing sensor histidine kinase [Lacticaseibacillus saniviri]MCG4281308.1 HAMP domain-containing histidine kinase [Lacticaseibacillus saniviri]
MDSNRGIKRQQAKLFITELLSFAGLFFLLGVIVFVLYRQSVYRDIDQSLDHQRQALIDGPKMNAQPLTPLMPRQQQPIHADMPLQSTTLVYNTAGQITNQASLGQRNYTYFKNIALDKSVLNQKQTLETNHGVFRTLLLKVAKTNVNPEYAGHYVLILQSVDGQVRAMNTFRQVLIITIVIFWLLALGLAYWLSRRAMRPIIRSWQRQQDFVADAAHELRAPLAVIQSQQEQLLTKPQAKIIDQSEAIATSLNETTRLKTLTNDLLTIAKADSNATTLNPVTIDLVPFFEQTLAPYADIANSQDKALTWHVPADSRASFDLDRIRQLLIILLDNALKYTAPGDSIWVNVEFDKRDWLLHVGNSGAPIADADKAKIFKRFYRTDASRNRQTGGSGLGLAIAQWIVDSHHGHIRVVDVEPRGVQFDVRLKNL